MKKRLNLVLLLVLYVVSFAACKNDDDDILPQEDKETYTIMMYGCGGGNLDKEMILNIQEALLTGTTDRVNFTGQIKFSARFQETEEFKGTQRFVVAPTNNSWFTPVEVLDKDLKLYDPQNLTDFINWSKIECPADEYILLLWNHGSAWSPHYDSPYGRAIVHDDVLNSRGLALDDLVRGIKDSGTKMKMIYYDACFMGMIEVLSGIRECADYALCATHVTPGIGGDYNSLIYHLNNSTNFELAMAGYIDDVMAHWDRDVIPLDLKLVNLGKMEHLLNEVKVLSGYLKDAAKIYKQYIADKNNGIEPPLYDDNSIIAQTFKSAINKCYHYYWEYQDGIAEYPFYDLHMLAELLAYGETNTYSARFIDISSRINRALQETIVYKEHSIASGGLDFSMGVLVVSNDTWVKDGYDKAYNNLKFDKLTDWGKWLSINPINPTGNPNPQTISGVNFDEEEPAEIPLEDEIEQMYTLIGKQK